jgi:multiple sugar transport system substrate-binding protein
LIAEYGADFTNLPDWNAYIDQMKKVTVDKNGDGKPEQFGFSNPLDLALVPLHGGKGNWFSPEGEPLEPEEPFYQVLDLLKKIKESGVATMDPPWSGDWINAYKEGRVVTTISGMWLGGHFQNWMCPNLSGDWRIAHLPGKIYSSYGGTYLGIPEQTKIGKLMKAWKVLKYLCSNVEAQLSIFKEIGAHPACVIAYEDNAFEKSEPYFGCQKIWAMGREIAMNIPQQYLTANDGIAVDIFMEACKSVVENKSPASAIAWAKDRILKEMK